MSRECKSCDYYEGHDWEDGTLRCGYDGGYECCPFNDEAPTKAEDKTRIVIDAEYFTEYIRNTLKNTFRGEARVIAEREIKAIVKSEYESCVKQITQEAVSKIVEDQVAEFMAGDITVGGGWSEPSRTLSRKEYLSELVEKNLAPAFEKDSVINQAKKAAEEAITAFTRKMRDDINAGIKKNFDSSVRQTLTDNVVSMLMSNETYSRLSSSMSRMLPDAK